MGDIKVWATKNVHGVKGAGDSEIRVVLLNDHEVRAQELKQQLAAAKTSADDWQGMWRIANEREVEAKQEVARLKREAVSANRALLIAQAAGWKPATEQEMTEAKRQLDAEQKGANNG